MCRSSTRQRKFAGQRPTFYHCATPPTSSSSSTTQCLKKNAPTLARQKIIKCSWASKQPRNPSVTWTALVTVLKAFSRDFASFLSQRFKANKVSTGKRTKKDKCTYHFWKCADAVNPRLTKLARACRNYSLPKLAHYFERQCSSSSSRV